MNRSVLILIVAIFSASFLAGCGEESKIEKAAKQEVGGEQLYTCGMHPHVIERAPGTCPICEMDLTPVKGSAPSVESIPEKGERRVKYWRAPMDPNYISDEPGKSPMGMDLVPVYEDEFTGDGSDVVRIDPVVVQNMGVRIERIERKTLFHHIRTIGEVEVGEDEISVVNLRFSGWVEKIYADKTGDPVVKGEALFEIYSPGLVAAQEEYLLAIRAQGAQSALARSSRRKLALWDLSEQDIQSIAKGGKARRTLPIRAPRSGFILRKNVVEGARVESGMDVYHVGDLSRILVTAEGYEFDAPWVEVGQAAQMELTYQKGPPIDGSVAYVYPTLNDKSRTLRVRLEFENPDYRLKPGMFATVYIEYRREDDVLTVPTEAIIHSGKRELVFVSLGDGKFEPREVVTGLEGDRHMTEVISGLHEGELIVASGQFLIDSESQLQEVTRKMSPGFRSSASAPDEAGAAMPMSETLWSCPMHPEEISDEPGRCPQCGMDLEERVGSDEELQTLHLGHDHAAHGGGVQSAEPGQYTCPMHGEVVSDEPGRCPVCGMFLEQVAVEEGDAQ